MNGHHPPTFSTTSTPIDRPILRTSTSQSSPNQSPLASPQLRPSIIHSSSSFSHHPYGGSNAHSPSRGNTPPPLGTTATTTTMNSNGNTPPTMMMSSSSSAPRVSFPPQPTRERSSEGLYTMNTNTSTATSNTTTTTAALPPSETSHFTSSSSSDAPTLINTEPGSSTTTSYYPSARRVSGSTTTAGGLGMPKTRTSSTGGTTTIHPEFGYTRKVGFETFEPSTDAALFSYTLQAKSDAYRRTRNTRVFMVAVSPDESGNEALEWLMESLIEDGDEIVAVRVVELDEGEKASKDAQEGFRDEAGGLLRKVLEMNDEISDRRISVIVEFVAGKVTSTLMRLISLYRPDSLIVGTKGSRSTLQKFGAAFGAPGMGSVSRYCVSHSPVPVIVVRPERKVKKTLAKRQNDPKRQKYKAMVGSEALGLRRSRSAESRDRGGALSE